MRQDRHRKEDSSGIPRYGSQAEIKFDGIVEEAQQKIEEDEDAKEERELFNFASAPQNSKNSFSP